MTSYPFRLRTGCFRLVGSLICGAKSAAAKRSGSRRSTIRQTASSADHVWPAALRRLNRCWIAFRLDPKFTVTMALRTWAIFLLTRHKTRISFGNLGLWRMSTLFSERRRQDITAKKANSSFTQLKTSNDFTSIKKPKMS